MLKIEVRTWFSDCRPVNISYSIDDWLFASGLAPLHRLHGVSTPDEIVGNVVGREAIVVSVAIAETVGIVEIEETEEIAVVIVDVTAPHLVVPLHRAPAETGPTILLGRMIVVTVTTRDAIVIDPEVPTTGTPKRNRSGTKIGRWSRTGMTGQVGQDNPSPPALGVRIALSF